MKTAIIGAGAIGTLFGGLLKKNNIDTVLFDTDRGKTEYIKKNGIKIIHPGRSGTVHVFPEASSDLSAIRSFDYYIFCVKAYSTEKAASAVAEVAGDNSVFITFQNGLGNIEALAKYLSFSSIAAGTTSEGATQTGEGEIIYGGKGITELSMIDPYGSPEKLEKFISVLNTCGLETSEADDYRRLIWKKLIINAAINPVTAVTHLRNRYISGSPFLRNISEKIAEEAVRIAALEDIHFDIDEIKKTVYRVAEKTGDNRSSMLQDIENKRKTEIDFISGAITDAAAKFATEAPYNRIMVEMVKALEKGYFT